MKATVKTPPAEDPNPSWFSRHSGALFVGGFGLVFAVAGLLIWFVAVPSVRAGAAAAEALSVVAPGHVPSHLEGSRVLLEAHIAADVPEVFRDFVAFRRREFRGWTEDGGRRREKWETKEIVAPAIALGDGRFRVFVVNPDYEMKSEPHQWRSTEGLEYLLFGPSTQDVVGFRRGDLVTIDGVLERHSRQPGIRAATMAGGDAAAYRAGLQESVAALQIVGPIFSGVGGILFVGGLVSLCRRRK